MNFQRSEIRGQRSQPESRSSSLNSRASIELRIEELVLHGFASSDRYAIGDALEGKLARLLEKQAVPNSLRSERAIDEMRGGTFNAPNNASPSAIGRQIAHAIYEGFRQ